MAFINVQPRLSPSVEANLRSEYHLPSSCLSRLSLATTALGSLEETSSLYALQHTRAFA